MLWDSLIDVLYFQRFTLGVGIYESILCFKPLRECCFSNTLFGILAPSGCLVTILPFALDVAELPLYFLHGLLVSGVLSGIITK
jgi:hypothetical protein